MALSIVLDFLNCLNLTATKDVFCREIATEVGCFRYSFYSSNLFEPPTNTEGILQPEQLMTGVQVMSELKLIIDADPGDPVLMRLIATAKVTIFLTVSKWFYKNLILGNNKKFAR